MTRDPKWRAAVTMNGSLTRKAGKNFSSLNAKNVVSLAAFGFLRLGGLKCVLCIINDKD